MSDEQQWRLMCEISKQVGEIHEGVNNIKANCECRGRQINEIDGRLRVLEEDRKKEGWMIWLIRMALGVIGIKVFKG